MASDELSPEQEIKVRAWLAHKGITCFYCRSGPPGGHLAIGAITVPLVIHPDGAVGRMQNLPPMVPVWCMGCGHLDFFSAAVMGVLPSLQAVE